MERVNKFLITFFLVCIAVIVVFLIWLRIALDHYSGKDLYLYIEGYISGGYVNDENGKRLYYSRDTVTGETTYYETKQETYRYVILNYETGEFQSYKTLEEVPEEARTIFEQKLTEECIQTRTCYEVF